MQSSFQDGSALLCSMEPVEEVFAAFRAIAADLARNDRVGAYDENRRFTVFQSLFHAYGDEAGMIPDGVEISTELVDYSIDLAVRRRSLGLYGGWAGLGWITSHFQVENDLVATHVDRVLTSVLKDWPRTVGYDLISGLVGVGVYFLERLPTETALQGLTTVLEVLERTAVRTQDGVTWFSPSDSLPVWQREQAPNGYYNLGVAHGVPGVCWLLGQLCREGIAMDRAEALLRRSLRWLHSNHPDPTKPDLPSWIAPGVPRHPMRRLAWCYGPLGASAVILEAATAIADAEGARWARTMALACAQVPPSEALIHDAGLCHGAAGNAHIFHRLYRNTGEVIFRKAAVDWFRATVAYRQPGTGVGGFRMWGEVGENRQGWLDDASFLTGSGGVGLALLSAVTDIEPKWDRLLLLS